MRPEAWRARAALGRTALLVALSLLVAASLVGVAWGTDRWTDISDSDWVSTYKVTAGEAATVADGFPDGSFHPYDPVTRGQFAKMSVNGLGLPHESPSAPTFSDVPVSHIFFGEIEGAFAAQIVTGMGDGTYRPGAQIRRQQANSILGRYLAQLEIDLNGAITDKEGQRFLSLQAWYDAWPTWYLGGFDDEAQIDPVHRPATAYLVYRGVVKGAVTGDGMWLRPGDTLSRVQAVAMVLRVLRSAETITSEPPAPVNLTTEPLTPSANAEPWVSGKTIAGGQVAIFDTFDGATREVKQGVADADGDFSIRVPALAEGLHSFSAKVKNAAGRMSPASLGIAYLHDKTGPGGSVLQPAAGAAVRLRKPFFTVLAADDGAGVASVTFQYRAAGGGTAFVDVSTDVSQPYEALWGDISLPDGQYEFRALIRDRAGNETSVVSQDVIVDLALPTVELQAPSAAGVFFTENAKPLFAAAAADAAGAGAPESGVARVDFLYAPASALPADPVSWTAADFTLLASDDSPGYSLDPAAWGEGLEDERYIFAVRSLDRAGNESPLATQEVVLDRAAPALNLVAPQSGDELPDNTPFLIQWTIEDVSGVQTVKLEYQTAAGAPWVNIAAAAPDTGSYLWSVPDVTVEVADEFRLRLTATDLAGPAVGNVGGHTTVLLSQQFTVIESPASATALVASDPDGSDEGLSGLDFKLEWTPSESTDAVSQAIYILPATAELDPGIHAPVDLIADAVTDSWTGPDVLEGDSAGFSFDPDLDYHLYVVTRDSAGRETASLPALWPALPPAAPTAVSASDSDSTLGVDGRDVSASWTVSPSANVVSQRLYLLPIGTTLVLTGLGAHTPVDVIEDKTTAQWTGDELLDNHSAGGPLAVGSYHLWVVAESEDGRLGASSGAPFAIAAP